MQHEHHFLHEHADVTRRYFLNLGLTAAALTAADSALFAVTPNTTQPQRPPEKAGAQPTPYFTSPENFRDVSRGKPIPHTLSEDDKAAAGITRDTWKLNVIADPAAPASLGRTFRTEDDTALDFKTLLQIGEKSAVRFAKVMTCLNLGCPLGMGLWEGVPLRDILWMTQPQENLRRVFYYGFHNNDPEQEFRSSLPAGRILEDPAGLPPVILCYKLNGEFLSSERGGPVRVVVPEHYGFKSIKWLTHIMLSNGFFANDTYGEQNNDVDSPMKTFAATLSVPQFLRPGDPIPVSGYAQVGISGLQKVQVWLEDRNNPYSAADDPYFQNAPWLDADLFPAPTDWSSLPGGIIPGSTFGFNEQGQPLEWPMRLTNAHWAVALPPHPVGEYNLRCRSVDANGVGQPLPRPFRKSGHAAIETIRLSVSD